MPNGSQQRFATRSGVAAEMATSVGRRRIGWIGAVALAGVLVGSVDTSSADSSKTVERVEWAAEVYEDLTEAPDRGAPEWLFSEARCIAIVPHVVKGAFFFGARFGKGILTCRNDAGEWSPLVFIALGGPSFGFQWGASATDLVLFFRKERGVRSLLRSRLTLGGDASIAAGPVGRRASAEVDVTLTAEILSYALSKGVFVGISLEGSYLGVDEPSNEEYYGRSIDPEALLFDHALDIVPASTQRFHDLLP